MRATKIIARLNGWQRIGIILSVVWAVGAPIYFQSIEVIAAQRHADYWLDRCLKRVTQEVQRNQPGASLSDFGTDFGCSDIAKSAFDEDMDGEWRRLLEMSLLPIPLGWLAAFVSLRAAVWVRAGFHQPSPPI